MTTPTVAPRRTLDRAWPYLSLVPLGLGAWGLIYAGYRARKPLWAAIGAVCTAAVVLGWVLAGSSDGDSDAGGLLLILGWVGAVAFGFALRGAFERRLNSSWWQALQAGRERLEERSAALELAESDPALAAEIGIGRPDEGGSRDAGLVDVNNASHRALCGLPRVDDALATRIVELRAELDGFASVEDLGVAADLDGSQVEALRGLVVFLPRRSA